MTLPTHFGIEVGRGGLDTALPQVQFNVVQACNDGGSNPNHAMLTQEVFVDIITNREDAKWQAEHDLAVTITTAAASGTAANVVATTSAAATIVVTDMQ